MKKVFAVNVQRVERGTVYVVADNERQAEQIANDHGIYWPDDVYESYDTLTGLEQIEVCGACETDTDMFDSAINPEDYDEDDDCEDDEDE